MTINTASIKKQVEESYQRAINLSGGGPAAVLHETSSSFTAEITFPDSIDVSEFNTDQIKEHNLTYCDPDTGMYNNPYTDTSHAKIDDNYSLNQCGKYNITQVTANAPNNSLEIVMELDVTKLNYPSTQDPYEYGHLVCLNAAVQNTPDYLAIILPNIQIKPELFTAMR